VNTTQDNQKYLVIDDHPLFRQGMIRLLSKLNPSYESQEAGNGFEAIDKFKKNRFEIIFLDIKMPKMDGIECFKKLRIIRPDCKIIIVSSFDTISYINEFISNGVNGYLLKSIDETILFDAISAVNNNEQYICSEVYIEWFKYNADFNKNKGVKLCLSLREIEIVKLICQNFTSKQIGELLHISCATVKNHRSHIFNKLGAKNVADLIVLAIREGLYIVEPI